MFSFWFLFEFSRFFPKYQSDVTDEHANTTILSSIICITKEVQLDLARNILLKINHRYYICQHNSSSNYQTYINYLLLQKQKNSSQYLNLMLTKNFHLFKKIIIIITAFQYSKNSQTSVSEQKYLNSNRNLTTTNAI